jgi:phosphopantetheinyl transferase
MSSLKREGCLAIIHVDKATAYPPVSMPAHYEGGTIRDESRLAYATLAYYLKKHFGLTYDAQTIAVTKYGKPFQRDGRYHFSLSHSSDYIACAIGNQELGVDIEQPRNISRKIYSKIMTRAEMDESKDVLLTWVIKEAYSKLRGVGVRLSFKDISANDIQSRCAHIIQQTDEYICVILYSNKDSHFIIEKIS